MSLSSSLTSVGSEAFEGCTGLTGLTFPASVTSIGYRALAGCTGLTSVALPAKLTSIPNSMFSDCSALKTVTIPGTVTLIDNFAFWKCTGLTKVTIPDTVTSIGCYAFHQCSNLTSVTLPGSLKTMDEGAFYNCSGLTSLKVPDAVTTIERNTFYGCSGLKNMTLPSSLTSVGAYAFQNCTGLTRLTIPDAVSSVGYCAFRNCTGLKSIVLPKSLTSVDAFAFAFLSSLDTVQYTGTKSQWESFREGVDRTNDVLLNVSNLVLNFNPNAAVSVAIKSNPNKLLYTVGESFSPVGMKLNVTTMGGAVKEITSGYTYTPVGKMNTEGQQQITVTYGGKQVSLYVGVNPKGKTVSSVAIKKMPTKNTYNAGEVFQSAGMVLKVTYADNTTAELSSGYTCTPSGKLSTAGQQKIVVTYADKSTGFYVTVG